MGQRWQRLFVSVLALALIASACGDDDEGGSPNTTAANVATTPATTLAPQKGGILNAGQFTGIQGLDPAKLAGAGSVGAIELSAIYDTLMRYNPDSKKYEGRTAQSLEPNADFTVWTLKLKPGIKFTDGTAYDAAAVKFVLDRQTKEGNANPRGQLTQFVDTMTVVDAMTMTFKLKLGWVGFPYVLSGANGMIYSPAAFQKVNDAAKFNITPSDAGAGPFKVKAYKPGESLELERNATYHGGEPYLDGVKFVTIPGAQATYDAIKTGTLAGGLCRRLRGHVEGQGREVRSEHDIGCGGQHHQHELGHRGGVRGWPATEPVCGQARREEGQDQDGHVRHPRSPCGCRRRRSQGDQRARLSGHRDAELGAVRQLTVGSEGRGTQGRSRLKQSVLSPKPRRPDGTARSA